MSDVTQILQAIEHGDFYASIGVEIVSYEVTPDEIKLELSRNRPFEDVRYRTYFIGRQGAVLKVDESFNPSYKFRGDELYVRVRVENSDRMVAWTQPVFPKSLK